MKQIITHLGRVLRVPSTTVEDYREARAVKTRVWRLLVESLDLYADAEMRFQEVKSEYLAKHGGKNTVEMQKDLEADERFKNAIADAPHYSRRITAYGTAYQAALARETESYQASVKELNRQRGQSGL